MARILAIGPHPDDVEIGMGGAFLARLAQEHGVVLCDRPNGEPTPGGTPERRAAEAAEAAHILGVGRRITLPLPNRMLADTVENRMLLAGVIREVRPDLLFIPYWIDAHPDHVAACALAEAARFYAKLTKTEIPGEPFYPPRVFHFISTHYDLHIKPTFLFDIGAHFERKLAAVAAYASQFADENGEMRVLQYLGTLNGYWGYLINRPQAEAFVCREELGLRSLDGVVERRRGAGAIAPWGPLTRAGAYTAAREPGPVAAGDLLLPAGHQPVFPHPGIWVKDLLLDRLAARGHTGLHGIVDSDAMEETGGDLPSHPAA